MELVNRIDPIEQVQSELIKSGLVQLELIQKIWFKNRVSMTGPIGTDLIETGSKIGTGQDDWSNRLKCLYCIIYIIVCSIRN